MCPLRARGRSGADHSISFSWGAVVGAQRYELAIFDGQWDDSPTYDEQQRQGLALRRIAIAAPALSWTPAGADCLDEGGSYLWFVRAATVEGEAPWSAPRYFAIDYDADALTQTVRRELAAHLRQPQVWREVIQAALSANRALQLTPLASAALRPPADTATQAGETGMGSAGETSAIRPQATSFPNPAALKINSANGVVFNQSATGGGIPAAGSGVRFMWYAGKAALRAGFVNGTQWDDANIGDYSTALGYGPIASGLASTALGYNTTTASGNSSTALGDSTIASGFSSTALGYGTTAKSAYETVVGRYNTDYTPANTTGWTSTDRLFVIGNGTDSSARSDALVVRKSGNVGIGTSSPSYRLQLGSDSAAKPGTTSWTIASDARLKDISGPYDSGLDEIAALQPVALPLCRGQCLRA